MPNQDEVFDKVIAKLKEAYYNNQGLQSITMLVKEICGNDNAIYSSYIADKLSELSLSTPMNNNDGTTYKYRVLLNANGIDWVEKYGNWTGYKKHLENKEMESKSPINLTVNQSQSQSQSQSISISILNEALQKELSDEQMQEIKDILASDREESEKKRSIIEKLKDFGQNVVENVLANIIAGVIL